jgi:putative phage-type endonuclease
VSSETKRKFLESYIIANTKDMPKEEWLRHRQQGIGGSEASAIAGLNPWKTAVGVYIDKKNETPKEIKSYRMEIGNLLEDFVAKQFSHKTGKKVRSVYGMLKNDKYPFAIANIDRAVVGEKAFLECKVTNSYAKKEWEEGVPIHYEIQCLHYMAITGATHCYIAALIGNEDLIFHEIKRDEDTINNLMTLEKEFWENHIMPDIPPEADGSGEYSEYLKNKYDKPKPETVELTELKDNLKRYDEVVDLMKDLEIEKKALEQLFQGKMGNYEMANIEDRVITWKPGSRTSIDSKLLKKEMPHIFNQYAKVSNYRTFRAGGR